MPVMLQLCAGDGVWGWQQEGWAQQGGSTRLSPAVPRAVEAAWLPALLSSLQGSTGRAL